MDTSIVVASVVAVVTPLLSWLGMRQATADARANMNRDLDSLKRLNPESAAAKTLEKDIDDAIRVLARRQKFWRDQRTLARPADYWERVVTDARPDRGPG